MSWFGQAGWVAYGAGLAPLTVLVGVRSAGPGGLPPLVGTELVLSLLLVTKGDPVGLFLRQTRPDRSDEVARRAASRQAATATALFLAVAAVTVLVAHR